MLGIPMYAGTIMPPLVPHLSHAAMIGIYFTDYLMLLFN